MSLKEEIFDLIREQDVLRLRYAELEKVKQDKLKALSLEEKNGDKLSSQS